MRYQMKWKLITLNYTFYTYLLMNYKLFGHRRDEASQIKFERRRIGVKKLAIC